jgi:hypothetical protein
MTSPERATPLSVRPLHAVAPDRNESARSDQIRAAAGQRASLAGLPSVEVALADVVGERVADVERQMADKMYARAGVALVDDFVAKGLAAADAERIVRKALRDFSSCALESYRSVAGESSFPAVLDAVEATLSDSDGPVIAAVVDVDAVRALSLPCVANVSQQAGIAFPE